MRVNFFDDPLEGPRAPEDVRLNQIGLYVYEGGRRMAVGFDITPFRERPSIEVTALNARGEPAGSLVVIQTLEANFSLTMHLRDPEPTDTYDITVLLYYKSLDDEERTVVDQRTGSIDVRQAGEHILK